MKWRVIKSILCWLMCLLAKPVVAGSIYPLIALDKVNVVDVEDSTLKSKQTILINNGVIEDIFTSGKRKIPKKYNVVDLKGHYLLPGFIDSHVHMATNPDKEDSLKNNIPRLQHLLRGGVTAVRDMGGDTRLLGYLKREALLDNIQSPDIFYSVIIGGSEFFSDPRTLTSAKGYTSGSTAWMRAVNENTDWESVIAQAKGAGATGIKIYRNVSPELLSPLVEQAERQGLNVWSHAFVQPALPMDAVRAGVDVLSHANILSAHVVDDYSAKRYTLDKNGPAFKAESYSLLWDSMKKNQTLLDSTLTVYETLSRKQKKHQIDYQSAVFNTQQAIQRGVQLVAGTDHFADWEQGELPTIHNELSLLVNDAGLTPMQAIQAATLNGAKAIGEQSRMGSVKKGKLANLIVTQLNPLENIEHTTSITHVIKNGQFVYRGDDERLPFSAARRVGGQLYLSGQIGNYPGTLTLNGNSIESQTRQTMDNIGQALKEQHLDYSHIVKCTLMLADIKDWAAASKVYKTYFSEPLPARSAFAASALAMKAKVEIECIAHNQVK